MRRPTTIWSAVLVLAAAATVAAAGQQPVSETGSCGPYSVTLKVLPAESFSGAHAAMVRDGGAEPVTLDSAQKPNQHLVVFVKKDGQPVTDAGVTIRYRPAGDEEGAWRNLPVVRMHEAGEGVATTHYGNNVRLKPAAYEASVMVNGSGPVSFRFTLR